MNTANKMNNKKYIAIFVDVIVAFVAFWGIGYFGLSNYLKNAERLGFINDATEFLSTNEEFLRDYGAVLSIEPDGDSSIKNDDPTIKEYYMDFVCQTEKGTYAVRIYDVWDDGWSFRYVVQDTNGIPA